MMITTVVITLSSVHGLAAGVRDGFLTWAGIFILVAGCGIIVKYIAARGKYRESRDRT